MARIYLSPPHMSSHELALIEEAFATNWIAPVGPHLDAFEREFAERVRVPHAVALSSGTAALHLAIKLVGVEPGDEVLCSDLTFCATANAIVYEGGVPVFIDANQQTLCRARRVIERIVDCRPIKLEQVLARSRTAD